MNDERRIGNLCVTAGCTWTMSATLDSRYSFTAQFLRGGAIFARHAHAIEASADASLSEEVQAEHRAYVVGAVVQAAAALESEISEVVMHGPGNHLGSNGLDAAGREYLLPLADVIDGKPTLQRYDLVLHLLRRPALERGTHPHQPADLLVRLRNELIHYKSKLGAEMDRQGLFERLEQLGFDKPGFISPHTNFFPHRCLSASLAGWSVETGVAFINAFYERLGIVSSLAAHTAELAVPSPRPRA